MTVSGILGFDNPRWLRGGPSSQSSPGGRRGKTSRPHPCLSPAGGLRTQGSRGLRGRWRTHPRRAPPTRLAARALSQSPPEGERFGGALPEGGGQRERASRDSPLREGEKRQDLPTPPMLEPAGGLRTQGSRGLRGRWRTHPRRAPPTRLAARALSQSPPEGERFGGALPEEGGQRERASRDSPLREGEKRQDLPPSPPSAKMEGARRP